MSPLSGVLSEAWVLYVRNAGHLIAVALAVYLVVAVITALLSLVAGVWGIYIGSVISLFALFLVQAALMKSVQDVLDGIADLNVRETLSAALPYLGTVTVASILASIGITIGFVFFIVPGLILLTYWSLIVPHIVIGGSGMLDAFGRSWRTVRGYAWRVFGTFVLLYLIMLIAQILIAAVLLPLPDAARNAVADWVAGTLVAPYIVAVVALIYYELSAAHGTPAEPGTPRRGQP